MSRPVRFLGTLLFDIAIAACVGVALWGCGAAAQEAITAPVEAFVMPRFAELVEGLLIALFAVVLLVEVARYAIKPLRKVKGQPPSEASRIGTVLLALAAGQLLAVWGIAPQLAEGIGGKVVGGFFASGLGVTFEQLVWQYIRRALVAKFGRKADKDEPEVTPGPQA